MVQSALIGLKQKKSVQQSQKKMRIIQQQQPRKQMMRPAAQQKTPRDYFPDLDFISVKGRAPLLMPHPGDHMTPMSDDAVIKQNKLRTLRHEMIQVSLTADIQTYNINNSC